MQTTFIEVLRSSPDERRALYAAAAADLQTRAENVEKDLYVCWILDFLFNQREGDPVNLYLRDHFKTIAAMRSYVQVPWSNLNLSGRSFRAFPASVCRSA